MTGPAPAQDKPDPPGTSVFLSRYRAWFKLVDANNDGYLDKEELAKAFRGPNAKPYDYVPPPKQAKDQGDKNGKDKDEKDKGNKDKDEKDKDANDKGNKDKDAKEKGEKDKDAKDKGDKDKGTDTSKPETKKDYSRYPDYQFLIQLDKDGDEQVSRTEFESWATDLAVQLKSQLDAQQRLLQAQLALQMPNIKAADRRKYQNQLNKEQQQLMKLQKQIQKLEQNFNQANRKPPRK
jgi:hypothetical protein